MELPAGGGEFDDLGGGVVEVEFVGFVGGFEGAEVDFFVALGGVGEGVELADEVAELGGGGGGDLEHALGLAQGWVFVVGGLVNRNQKKGLSIVLCKQHFSDF